MKYIVYTVAAAAAAAVGIKYRTILTLYIPFYSNNNNNNTASTMFKEVFFLLFLVCIRAHQYTRTPNTFELIEKKKGFHIFHVDMNVCILVFGYINYNNNNKKKRSKYLKSSFSFYFIYLFLFFLSYLLLVSFLIHVRGERIQLCVIMNTHEYYSINVSGLQQCNFSSGNLKKQV